MPRLMLHFPPILAGKRIWMRGFHKIKILRFRLQVRPSYMVDVK